MVRGIRYKDYEIYGGAVRVPNGWVPALSISKHRDAHSQTRDNPFYGLKYQPSRFPTAQAAIEAALQMGTDIIDGKVAGTTVNDL